jgi:hypothetical protein
MGVCNIKVELQYCTHQANLQNAKGACFVLAALEVANAGEFYQVAFVVALDN